MKLQIEKLRREVMAHAPNLLDQLELQLEELEANAAEAELAAETASRAATVEPHRRKRPARRPFPSICRASVSSSRTRELPLLRVDQAVEAGRERHETLEVIPRRWKVIQTVREKFSCRHCESIAQPPAPFHG